MRFNIHFYSILKFRVFPILISSFKYSRNCRLVNPGLGIRIDLIISKLDDFIKGEMLIS